MKILYISYIKKFFQKSFKKSVAFSISICYNIDRNKKGGEIIPLTEKKKITNNKYRSKLKRYEFQLNPDKETDRLMMEKLTKVKSLNGYIKDLIKKDLNL